MSSISSIGSTASALSSAITGSSSTGSSSSSGVTGASNISGTGILSSLGLGSGLDVSSIITALVNAAEAGPQQQITNQTTSDNNEIAGLTGLSTVLSGLESALSELTSSTTYQTYNATFASGVSGSIGSATTLPDATPGTYDVDVTQLAKAQMRTSSAYASGAPVGAGSLTIGVGSNSMDISVSSTDTLEDVASSINNASNNPGVTATVVAGTSGDQLVLTSSKTGTANGFTISADSGSSSGLSSLATTLGTAGSHEAANAVLTVDGIAVTSASNSVSGALTGVTMNLTSTGSSTLTVAQSTTPISTAVNDFVTAYNAYNTAVNQLTSYDSTSKEAGILLGDPTMAAIQSQLSQVMSSSVAGNSIGSLANLGITRNSDGSLSLSSTQLATALSNDPSSVQNLFASSKGIATQMSSLVTNYNSSTGILQTKITNLNSDITNLQSQQTALNARMATYQQQLVKQYTALGSLMSSLNNTSSYLTALSKQSSSSD